MKIVLLSTLAFLSCFANVASAQTLITPPTFTISSLYFSAGANYMVRVFGFATGFCPANFAYVNAADDSSQQKVAGLMLAYATGKAVTLTLQTGTGGYCNVVEFQVAG